jgi:hypothetical protein
MPTCDAPRGAQQQGAAHDCALLHPGTWLQDRLLALIKQWAPDLVPSSRFELVHNMSSPQEALDKPATLVDTGVGNISHTWNVGSWQGFGHE